jgi:hypothetical protein
LYVEKYSDELWIGVKGQTNLEIAGSPRNIFRYSLALISNGGRALDGLGVLTGLPNLTKLRIPLTAIAGVRLRELSSVVERETAQIAS